MNMILKNINMYLLIHRDVFSQPGDAMQKSTTSVAKVGGNTYLCEDSIPKT